MDFQQRQIALLPARGHSKKHAILYQAFYTSLMSLEYDTFFGLGQWGKKDISYKIVLFTAQTPQ
jgi:hypothetical protein